MRKHVRATAACALALATAACQPTTTSADPSSGGGSTLTASATLRLTATRAAEVGTYSADLHEEGTADGRDTKVSANFRFRRRPSTAVSADFTQLNTGGSAGSGEAHAVLIGGVLYLDVPILSPMLSGGKRWLRLSLTGLQQVTGIDAAALVGSLLESGPATLSSMFTAATDATSDGTETIDGVETTHLKGTVTLHAALQQLDSTERDRVRQLYKSDGTISFDLWTDSDHLPRKAAFKVEGTDTPTSTTVTFHYGQAVRISAPPADQAGGLLSGG